MKTIIAALVALGLATASVCAKQADNFQTPAQQLQSGIGWG